MKSTKLKAFTLSELLVVLVIVGILVLLALPSLMPLITRTRSLEAKKGLKHVHTLQKTYYFEYSKFSDDLEALGFEQEGLVSEEAGNANYLIEMVEATPTTFLARATAVVDFDGDGEMNIWEIDQNGKLEEVQKD
jgi:type IV pilus assembly protein PilE